VFKIKISRETSPGYSSPTESWHCPLCEYKVYPDLMEGFAELQAKIHLVEKHYADPTRLKAVVKER
jgi:hypothetical protein